MRKSAKLGNIDDILSRRLRGEQWPKKMLMSCVEHTYVVKWLIENNCTWDDEVSCYYAAMGNIEMLDWLFSKKCAITKKVATIAARKGRLEVLEWYKSKYIVLPEKLSIEASKKGRLEVLEWLKDNKYDIEIGALASAIKNRRTRLIDYLLDKHCPLKDESVCNAAIIIGDLKLLINLQHIGFPLSFDVSNLAARYCHLDILKYLKEQDLWIIVFAINGGDKEIVQYLNDVPITSYELETCCERGRLDLLKECMKRCINTDNALGALCIPFAAKNGDIEMIKYLRSHVCPWDELATRCAVESGEYETLEWLIMNDCPHDSSLIETAVENGNWKILIWAVRNKCIMSKRALTLASSRCEEMTRYLIENGCPFDRQECIKCAKNKNALNVLVSNL